MNLSPLNLGANLSFMPFLDPDLALPSLDDPDLRGNGEESHTSLEEELEARGLAEVAVRAAEEATTRKVAKTPAFLISERSPSSTAVAWRTLRCRLSSPHLLDVEGRKRGDEEKKDEEKDEAMTTRLLLGIMATGAINVVRGTRSSNEELFHIYDHSESNALVVDNPQFFNRLAESFITRAHIRFVVLLWGEKSHLKSKFVDEMPIYEYKDIVALGQQSRHALLHSWPTGQKYVYEAINPEDVATLMYTSGTSGIPKGVMLTHQNLLHQIKNLWDIVPAEAGDRFLSMLPTWHAYERATEYFIFTYGIEQVYTNIKRLKDDLKLYQPQYLISVPLVYETLYSSIQKQISSSSGARKFVALMLIKVSLLYMEAKRIYEGGVLTIEHIQESLIIVVKDWLWARIVAVLLWPLHMLAMKLVYSKIHSAIGISKAGISGGASLPLHIDRFFEAIGVKVQNGYGLTETSPVVAARRPSCNVLGTIGHPLKYTEIKIVDMKTGEVLPDGLKGIVKVKGPQVMKGYYKVGLHQCIPWGGVVTVGEWLFLKDDQRTQ